MVALGVGAAALDFAPREEQMAMGESDMADMPMAGARSTAEAGVRGELVAPPTIAPNAPARLVYRFVDERSGAPLTDIVVSHEAQMHLIAVSRDLREFQHVHPTFTERPGELAVDVTFPRPGLYQLYGEFTRADGTDVVQQDLLVVGAPANVGPALVEDRAPKQASGVQVALSGAATAAVGQESSVRAEPHRRGYGPAGQRPAALPGRARARGDPARGRPVVRAHARRAGRRAASHGDGAAEYGPEIAFHHTFDTPGLYKLWAQFRTHGGQIATADFVVRARVTTQKKEPSTMANVVLNIPDISCEHCERTITRALTPVAGVQHVSVDIPTRQARVEYDASVVDVEKMKAILEEEDYPVAVGRLTQTQRQLERSTQHGQGSRVRYGRRRGHREAHRPAPGADVLFLRRAVRRRSKPTRRST